MTRRIELCLLKFEVSREETHTDTHSRTHTHRPVAYQQNASYGGFEWNISNKNINKRRCVQIITKHNVNMRKANSFFALSQQVYFATSLCLVQSCRLFLFTRIYSDCPAANARMLVCVYVRARKKIHIICIWMITSSNERPKRNNSNKSILCCVAKCFCQPIILLTTCCFHLQSISIYGKVSRLFSLCFCCCFWCSEWR